MEISKIVIENFKGIEHVELSPVKPINVLIGRNNSGKSSILKCINFLHEFFNRNTGKAIGVPVGYFREGLSITPELRISISVMQTKEERKEQFIRTKDTWNAQNKDPHISDAAINAQLDNDLFSSLKFNFAAQESQHHFGLVSINTKYKNNKGDVSDILIAESEDKSPGTRMLGIPLLELLITRQHTEVYPTILDLVRKHGIGKNLVVHKGQGSKLAGSPQELIPNLLSPSFEYIAKRFRTAFLVGPYRHANEKMASQMVEQLSQNGSNLVNYIHKLSLNNNAVFKDISDFVKRIVPEVGRLHPRFTMDSGSPLELAYERTDGTTVNLANMGGGVEQLIMLGSLLIHQRTACILWEEPESHLHPGAQDVLLTELEKLVGDSVVFLTTHSPVFIRASEKIAVHAIRNPNGKSATGKTLSEIELQEAASIIGARAGHLAQADIVVYVEGLYGAAVVEEWIKKWPDYERKIGHLRILVQWTSPEELASDEYDLEKLRKVSPYMVIFADKDSDEEREEPKDTRKKLQGKCAKLNIPCIITKQRQIEDYLPEDYFEKFWSPQLLESWKKEKKFTSGMKKHNREIAAAMDWGQVEKHKDIMEIYAEIVKYAEQLKP
jgi:predicted ATPase